MDYYLPIVLIIGSNIVYHLTAKSTPENLNPFLMLVITYLVGATAAAILFMITRSQSLSEQTKEFNWTPFVLGITIIGLEAGSILMYRAGWNISIGSLVANIGLAVILIVIGVVFYKDSLSIKQIIGILFCLAGMALINL